MRPIKTQTQLFKTAETIGVLCFGNEKREVASLDSPGLRYILGNSKYQYVACRLSEIDKYERVLLPLLAVNDVTRAAAKLPDRHDSTIIVGGASALSIASIKDKIDICNFGRCDTELDAIIEGYCDSSIWTRKQDPGLMEKYTVRQTSELLPFESSIGCRYKCKFCQYTYTRKLVGFNYTHGKDLRTQEDHWNHLVVLKGGQHTTALDGLSEETRMRVGKGITDADICDKISNMLKIGCKTIKLKVFMIVGYPWETPETVGRDLLKLSQLLQRIKGRGRVFIQFLFTPFSPEPLTPMACEPANVADNWNHILKSKNLCDNARINAYILPQINDNVTLALRVLTNRGAHPAMIKELVKTRQITPEMLKYTGRTETDLNYLEAK